jgi:uncharacterized protein (TIGR02444 family)
MLNLSAQNFWQFSIELYQHHEAQSLLLNLQDEVGVNVNLALFCAYLDSQQIYVTQAQFTQLLDCISNFNQTYTTQLRQLRKSVKANADSFKNYKELRQHLLNAELELEKQEQQLLVERAQLFSLNSSEAQSNLQLYQTHISAQNKEKTNSLQKLSDLNQFIH